MSLLTPTAVARRGGGDGAGSARPDRRRALGVGLAVGAVYLAVAVAVWWQVWSSHPTATMTCGCGDPALFVWSFGWMAHALAHGQDPFFSTAMYHPAGVNLLANATAPLEAFVLAPVTWAFGPVAAVNVANTLAPAVSAATTYWAVRRILGVGRLAALVAGLVVELSPGMIGSAGVSHLQIGMLAFVPVIVVCLHELLVVQQGRPWRWVALLALAGVGQFFTGTELLVIVALLSAVVVAVAAAVVGLTALRGSPAARRRLRYGATGLVAAGLAAGAMLAGPAWFALAGPRHVTGPPWPGEMGVAGVAFDGILSAHNPAGAAGLYHLAGYAGPLGAPVNYLGFGALAVAAVAVALCWRRRAAWLLLAVAVAAEWLALGAKWHPVGSPRPWWLPFLPWATVGRLPVISGVLAQNFAVVTLLAVAGLVALAVDRVARAGAGLARVPAVAAAVALSALALGPLATSWSLPLTAAPIDVPAWFVHEGPRLPAGSVVLALPFPGPPGDSEAMVWQAVDHMHFSIAGGCCLIPGPDGTPDHGAPGSGNAVLGALSSGLEGAEPGLTDLVAMARVRSVIASWQVTTIVVTDRGRDPAYATRWLTALFSRPPSRQDGAAVWTVAQPRR